MKPSSLVKDFSVQALFMGLLAAFVGFASSFAVVLQGLRAVGATDEQAASGLMALSLAMGISAILLSVTQRMPISAAWSTPGAALLVATGAVQGGFAAAVGAFIICGVLIVLAGLFKPLSRAVSSIPAPLANAMLAGVIVGLCYAPIEAIAFNPFYGLAIVTAWIVVGAINRLWAVPAALLAFVLIMVFGIDIPDGAFEAITASLAPPLVLIMPEFNFQAMISIAIPLFIVTMASQNIPGIAVLKVNGYEPKPGGLFTVTGIFSLLATPFGAHAINLAAITAALCAGPDAHADPKRRYWAAIISGVGYIVFGLLAGAVVTFVSLAPPILIQAVAGLALIGAFSGSIVAALADVETREAAAITFLITASGINFAGIAGAFWGLLAGVLMLGATKFLKRAKK